MKKKTSLNLEREATPTDLARAILSRLIALEKRIDRMDAATKKEFESHFEMIAQNQAKILPNGCVRLVAMQHETDCIDQFEVVLNPETVMVIDE